MIVMDKKKKNRVIRRFLKLSFWDVFLPSTEIPHPMENNITFVSFEMVSSGFSKHKKTYS